MSTFHLAPQLHQAVILPGPERILRKKEVCQILGISKATIDRKVRSGDFPPPIQISVRAIGWRESEIEDYINSREPVSRFASTTRVHRVE